MFEKLRLNRAKSLHQSDRSYLYIKKKPKTRFNCNHRSRSSSLNSSHSFHLKFSLCLPICHPLFKVSELHFNWSKSCRMNKESWIDLHYAVIASDSFIAAKSNVRCQTESSEWERHLKEGSLYFFFCNALCVHKKRIHNVCIF